MVSSRGICGVDYTGGRSSRGQVARCDCRDRSLAVVRSGLHFAIILMTRFPPFNRLEQNGSSTLLGLLVPPTTPKMHGFFDRLD